MTEAVAKANYKWRVVDIVVAAIIAVASGVIFWGWDIVCSAPLALFEGVTPGFEGLLNGFWLFAGPLAAIIVRKPGAALFAETLAAFLELTLGNQWGVGGSLIVGIIQGLCRNCLRRLRLEEVEHRHHHPVRCARRRGLLGLLLGHQPGLERPARHLVSGGLHHLRRRDRRRGGLVLVSCARRHRCSGAF